MAKKKDSGFYAKKAQVLRDFGIEATPRSELKIVGIEFNENHFAAIAENKGLTVEEFTKLVEDKAHGIEPEPEKESDTAAIVEDAKDPSAADEDAVDTEPAKS